MLAAYLGVCTHNEAPLNTTLQLQSRSFILLPLESSCVLTKTIMHYLQKLINVFYTGNLYKRKKP